MYDVSLIFWVKISDFKISPGEHAPNPIPLEDEKTKLQGQILPGPQMSLGGPVNEVA